MSVSVSEQAEEPTACLDAATTRPADRTARMNWGWPSIPARSTATNTTSLVPPWCACRPRGPAGRTTAQNGYDLRLRCHLLVGAFTLVGGAPGSISRSRAFQPEPLDIAPKAGTSPRGGTVIQPRGELPSGLRAGLPAGGLQSSAQVAAASDL